MCLNPVEGEGEVEVTAHNHLTGAVGEEGVAGDRPLRKSRMSRQEKLNWVRTSTSLCETSQKDKAGNKLFPKLLN